MSYLNGMLLLTVKGNLGPLKGGNYKLCCCVEMLHRAAFYATIVI